MIDIDLGLVKQHLRVSHSNDDVLIRSYLASAKAWVRDYLDGELVSFFPPNIDVDTYYITMDENIRQAILLKVSQLYEHAILIKFPNSF